MDLDLAAVLSAFADHKLDLSELVGRLDEISRTAEKPTKDGGSIEDGATRLAATKELLAVLKAARPTSSGSPATNSKGIPVLTSKLLEAEAERPS